MLGALLLFAWAHNRKIQALAWWGAAFCLIPLGIGIANLGKGLPSHLNLAVAHTFAVAGYGALYAGCRAFNGRAVLLPVIILGPAVWLVAFALIHESFAARLVLLSLINGGYAALSARELWKHAPRSLASQRAAVVLLLILAGFNFVRGTLSLSLSSIFWLDAFASRWSTEIALFLVVYAPALAFIFLSMAKERLELDYRKTEQALRESEEHYRYSVEFNPQIPWTADPQGNISNVSPRWCQLTGMSVEEALGEGWTKALHPDDYPGAAQQWTDAVASRSPLDVEYRVCLADGGYRWVRARATPRTGEDDSIICWYGTVEDIHDQKLAEERLRWAAYHDDLTGLPNRRYFQECLQQTLEHAEHAGGRVGLLITDLDDFKQINDRFGHDAGDEFLIAFGDELIGLIRPTNTIARLGGDEFAIILPDVGAVDDIVAVASAIQARMREPLRLSTGTQRSRTSIGGAISGSLGTSADELLKQADLALYSCKAAGRGLFEMFSPAMRDEAQKRASALEVARQAVALDRIEPFYQPKVDLDSGRLTGFEALLRWRHPRLGVQLPETLAHAFEDPELGITLGNCMLARVISDMRRWLDMDLPFGRISINASSADFRQADYAQRLLTCLRDAGIPPSLLGVEVTETVFLDRNVESAQKTLQALSAGGISIALDDFGTGYASLSHLKQFPVNVIKIDRAFVSDLMTDVGNAAIVKAVLRLGQSLGIRVIAEGVETAGQVSFLREHGCNLGQGYYFGRPMAADDVVPFIRSWMPSGQAKAYH
ncbi:diguanylate cyclase/phosphodiesterase [Microvirga subterranea]|uniref:Diguanylate cyclase/phosphodiesterase n=2 Tax=Microvirga subterranea TaxID=186651 RepID=A0A370H2L3_9HYPH|nr:diguanylate cyclase/phosphodiesterase [Microvirga subterranea]